MDIKAILERQGSLESDRSTFDAVWQDAARELFPRGDEFRSKTTQGTRRNLAQVDAFPLLALHRYAAAMDSGMTPRTTTWHHLATGEEEIDEQPEVKAYLEQLNRILWRTRYSPRANFAAQNHEVFLAGGAFGNGVVYAEAHPSGGARYRVMPLSQCYWRTNTFGRVDTFHRKFEMPVRELVRKFNQPGDDLGQKVSDLYQRGKLDDPFTLLHVVMPREDYDRSLIGRRGQPFTDLYVSVDDAHVTRSAGFYEFPYAIHRHAIAPGEDYGRGPGMDHLPDISMLQRMSRTIIDVGELEADPPLLLPNDDVLTQFRVAPGGRMFGGLDHDGTRMVEPLMTRSNPTITRELIEDRRNQIDDAFLGVYFRVLLENPQMTATQAMLVAQQQGQMVSPVVGRAQSEYLGPLIRRESGILHRQGRHPVMPQAMREYLQATGESLGLTYESPMTRAAENEEGVAILRAFETLSPIAQVFGPEVFSRINPDELAKTVFEVHGVPQKVLFSDEEMQAKEGQQQAAAAIETMLQAAPVAAQTAKDLAQAQQISQSAPQPVA